MSQQTTSGKIFLIAAMVLLLGMVCTVVLAYQLSRSNTAAVDLALASEVQQLADRVQSRIQTYQYGLRGMRGVVLALGADQVRRADIERYSRTRDLAREFPGARGFGFIRRVAPADEPAFLLRNRQDGFPGFSLRQLAPHDGEHFVIQFIEPLASNRPAVGLDIASERARREAAIAAMQTGQARLTAPITLVQASARPQQSFLILLPVYREGSVPATEQARISQCLGWTYAPLSMGDVIGELHRDHPGIFLEMRDIGRGGDEVVFFRSGVLDRAQAMHRWEGDFGGRHWRYTAQAGPQFVASLAQVRPGWVVAGGLLASFMLAGLVSSVMVGRDRRRQILAGRNRMAALVAASNDAIIGLSLDGRVSDWNQGAERIFGYRIEEVRGQVLAGLLIAPDEPHQPDAVLGEAAGIQPLQNFEARWLRKDGQVATVSVSAARLQDSRGRLTGVSLTARDVSQQKAAELQVLQMNASLEQQVAERSEKLGAAHSLINNVLDAASALCIIATDLNGTIRIFNRGAERLLGYRAEELVGKRSPALLHLREEVEARGRELSDQLGVQVAGFRVFVEIPEREGSESREWTYVRKDGSHFPVSLVATTMRDQHGALSGYLGVAIDISDRKLAEARLSANLALTQAILDTAATPIVSLDLHGVIRTFNPAAERVFGYAAAQIIGQNIRRLLPDPTQAAITEHVSLAGVQPAAGRDTLAQRSDGSQFPVRMAVGAAAINGEPIFVALLDDVSQELQQRAALLAVHQQLEMAANVARLGVWSYTPAEDRLVWNDWMFAIYERPLALRETGLNYLHWRDRVHPDDVEATEAALMAALRGEGVYEPVFRLLLPDGRVRFIQGGAQLERAADGSVLRITGINIDVTRQMELETTLREAKQRSDEASAAKSAFLANMSHEIRTPMNAVLGMLQLLQKTTLDERQYDYLQKAHSAAGALLGLLNDILDFSKIEAGKLVLDPHPFDLEPLLQDLASMLSASLGDKPLELVFAIDPHLPRAVVGDRLRLLQVLINLASNALKFTMQGEVVVEVSLLASDGDALTLGFAVHDTGIGISEEQQTRIFEGFVQAEASTTRRFGGTGLGLVICKRLVEMMGGTLSLHSIQGQGSRFGFALQLVQAGAGSLVDGGERPAELAERLLLAETNVRSAVALRIMLQAMGWQVDLAQDADALAVLQGQSPASPYALVLACSDLSAELDARLAPGLPMLVLARREQALPAGNRPQHMLTKPLTPAQLSDGLLRVLGRKAAIALAMPPRSQRLAGMHLLVVEDNPLNRQVAAELLGGEGADVVLADGGVAGVAAVQSSGAAFDAVIMDLQMPDIDGLEACRLIRADGRFDALIIVAMTANASESDRQACMAAGMNEHMGKPIDLEAVVPMLLRLTGRASVSASVAPAPPAGEVIAASTDVEPIATVLRRFGGNQALYQEFLGEFLAEAERTVDELMVAIASGKQDAAVIAAHTLKGVAATIGASALAARAKELEAALRQGGAEQVAATAGGDKLREALLALAQRCQAALAQALS
ncbi:PAS domain S-box protein [Chitinimonas sp.]|uniref:PAS domain S-box protein n=1 Tax=Chitinimonas sp. TaxID=1934313 RepID=UPI0035B24E84